MDLFSSCLLISQSVLCLFQSTHLHCTSYTSTVSFLQILDASNVSAFCPAQSGLWLLLWPHLAPSHISSLTPAKSLLCFLNELSAFWPQGLWSCCVLSLEHFPPAPLTSSSPQLFTSKVPSSVRPPPLSTSAKGPLSVSYLTTFFYFFQRTAAPWRQGPGCPSHPHISSTGSISTCWMHAQRTMLGSVETLNESDRFYQEFTAQGQPFLLFSQKRKVTFFYAASAGKSHFLFSLSLFTKEKSLTFSFATVILIWVPSLHIMMTGRVFSSLPHLPILPYS